jgi:hypothetical protein
MPEPRASGLAFEWVRLSAAKLFPYIPNPGTTKFAPIPRYVA